MLLRTAWKAGLALGTELRPQPSPVRGGGTGNPGPSATSSPFHCPELGVLCSPVTSTPEVSPVLSPTGVRLGKPK